MAQIIKTNGSRAVVITTQPGHVWANLYVGARHGIENASITNTRWQGKTLAGAECWAKKQLGEVEPTKRELPAPGARVVLVCGPGESSNPKHADADRRGTVLSIVTDQWGSHALVLLDCGKTHTVAGLTTIGIGAYLAAGKSTTEY